MFRTGFFTMSLCNFNFSVTSSTWYYGAAEKKSTCLMVSLSFVNDLCERCVWRRRSFYSWPNYYLYCLCIFKLVGIISTCLTQQPALHHLHISHCSDCIILTHTSWCHLYRGKCVNWKRVTSHFALLFQYVWAYSVISCWSLYPFRISSSPLRSLILSSPKKQTRLVAIQLNALFGVYSNCVYDMWHMRYVDNCTAHTYGRVRRHV